MTKIPNRRFQNIPARNAYFEMRRTKPTRGTGSVSNAYLLGRAKPAFGHIPFEAGTVERAGWQAGFDDAIEAGEISVIARVRIIRHHYRKVL